jgi:thiol:disulfide interchange protein
MTTSKSKKLHRKFSSLPQFFAIGVLALVIFALLMIKTNSQPGDPAAISTLPPEAVDSQPWQDETDENDREDLPETQLNQALQSGQPVLVFYHATGCHNCTSMSEIVAQVYPDFSESIALVDVNVVERRNMPLVKQAKVQYIPTLNFYDQNGQGQVFVGVMEADQLRETLTSLAGGE